MNKEEKEVVNMIKTGLEVSVEGQIIEQIHISRKEAKALLNLIQKQSKIIDEMAEEILKIDTAKSKFEYDHAKVWDTEKGIKEYFKKVVDEECEK